MLFRSPVKKEKEVSEIDYNDSFQPIIDFPNFLLIVLKITRMQEKDFNPSDFTLDDKELINEFDKVKLTPEFVKQFAYNLLLAKYYLDISLRLICIKAVSGEFLMLIVT